MAARWCPVGALQPMDLDHDAVIELEEAQEPEAPTEDSSSEKGAGTAPYAGPISGWLVVSLCLDLLTQQVRGYWSAARLQACLPRWRRFCRGSPRRRVHQETQVRAWLSQPPFEAG